MSLSSFEVEHRRAAFHVQHEPVCDRCGHGVSLHTLERSVPCIGCGERTAAGYASRAACIGFAPDWFDNSRRAFASNQHTDMSLGSGRRRSST